LQGGGGEKLFLTYIYLCTHPQKTGNAEKEEKGEDQRSSTGDQFGDKVKQKTFWVYS